MSRRKQGRPQQRKTQDSLEQENDLLVCGDCQTSFPLHDIVHFIKHKNQCCNKENVDGINEVCRRPDKPNNNSGSSSSNNEVVDEINKTDNEQDVDDEGVDLSRSSPRREEDDEMSMNNDNESLEETIDTQDQAGFENGEKKEANGRKGKKEFVGSSVLSPSRELRAPLRQRLVVDAESNTTHSEPSRFMCETCRSTYTSAWALLQHAQKEHGMKIYTSPVSSGGQHHQSSSGLTTGTVSAIDSVLTSPPGSSREHRAMSTGSGGSASPYPLHTSNPFSSPFRLPLDSRVSHPTSLSPFSRPPNFDFDLINDYRLRPQLLARGLEHSSFTHGPFDHTHISPALETHFDFYSKRLKQLASAPATPQTKSQHLSVAATTSPSKSESPPQKTLSASSARESGLTSTLSLPPKPKACEFCGKRFRFQSNLVVHRRSHTGEKPYKCPQCLHACTQQSKLKRHMKTHSNKAEEEASPSAAVNHKEDEGDDNDEDDDEGEEECEEENGVDEEMNEDEREDEKRVKESKNRGELAPDSEEIDHDAKRIKLEEGNAEDKGEEDSSLSDVSKSKPSESLLSEVMKKTGLNDVQTYSEAYKAALAESRENGRIKNEDNAMDDLDCDETASPKSGVKRELESEMDSDKEDHKENPFQEERDLLNKSVKRETSTPTSWSSGIETLASNNIDSAASSVYSRLHHSWFHADNPMRLFYSAYPPRLPSAHDLTLNPESHNGLNLSPSVASTSSALKSDGQGVPGVFKSSLTSSAAQAHSTSSSSSSPTGSLVLPNNGSSSVTPPRKESKRNDTCEFCGKVFKNCSNLTVHRRSHTGEKPYKCNLCSYACAQSSKLTRHMKTHGRQGKDVYTCKFCSMPFSVPSTLEKHMRKCVENRNARLILATDAGDHSSESNGEVIGQPDSAADVY